MIVGITRARLNEGSPSLDSGSLRGGGMASSNLKRVLPSPLSLSAANKKLNKDSDSDSESGARAAALEQGASGKLRLTQ
eukprot:1412689-Rhodomonas_salina.1